jgi:hypothetical protein
VDDNEKLISPIAWRQTGPEYLINQQTKVIFAKPSLEEKILLIEMFDRKKWGTKIKGLQ